MRFTPTSGDQLPPKPSIIRNITPLSPMTVPAGLMSNFFIGRMTPSMPILNLKLGLTPNTVPRSNVSAVTMEVSISAWSSPITSNPRAWNADSPHMIPLSTMGLWNPSIANFSNVYAPCFTTAAFPNFSGGRRFFMLSG